MAQPYNPYAPTPGPQGNLLGVGQNNPLAMFGKGPSYGRAAQGIVQQGGQAGFFNPMGSPQILAAVRQMALRNSMNQQHRGALLSQLLGLDPQQARAAQLGFEQQGGSDISNALLGAGTQQLTGAQDFIRQLFGQGLQGEQQMAQARAAAKAAQQANRGAIAGTIGRIGASFIPGIGPALAAMGGGGGGGSYPGQAPNYQNVWQSIGGG